MRLTTSEIGHPTICKPATEVRDAAGYDVKRETVCPNDGEGCAIIQKRLLGLVAISTEYVGCALGYLSDRPPATP